MGKATINNSNSSDKRIVGSIRWGKSDENELKHSIKNYNAKISRELKKDSTMEKYLPDRKSIKIERANAQAGTRKEFKQIVKWVQKFSEPKAVEKVETLSGIKATKWEVDKARETVRRLNIHNAAERKKTDTDYLKGLSDPDVKMKLRKRELKLEAKTPTEFKKFVASAEKMLSSKYQNEGFDTYKDNYLKALKSVGIDNPELVALIERIPAKELYRFTMDSPDTKIDFIYDIAKVDDIEERILERFEMQYEGLELAE